MTGSLEELVNELSRRSILSPEAAAKVLADGVPAEPFGRRYESFGTLDEPPFSPHFWWVETLDDSEWWYLFWFEAIADTQMDDELLDRIAPVVARLGVDLTHDWNVGEQPNNPELRRIWINDEPVDYTYPVSIYCVQPLVRVNELLATAESDHRFFFTGVQWESTHTFFVDESVSTILLPIDVAKMISESDHVVEAAKPILVDEILTGYSEYRD